MPLGIWVSAFELPRLVEASVDAREAARFIVAQIEGRVLLAKLHSDPAQMDALWQNSLDLLQAPASTASVAA